MITLITKISASITGFENPTITHRQQALNLSEMFVHSPTSMHLIESPTDHLSSGISSGDWLLVDASRQPLVNDIVLIERFDERYVISWAKLYAHKNRHIDDWDNMNVLGVITMSIHHFRNQPALPEHENMTELDLHVLLIELEHSTVICRADGESMLPHIFNNDLILLERHIAPIENDVCVLALNHDLVCKRVHLLTRQLLSDNPKFPPYKVTHSDYLRLHGVVRYSFRLHRELKCIA